MKKHKLKLLSNAPSWKKVLILAVIVVLFNVTIYFGTMQHDFLKDDFRLIVENSRIKSFQAFWQAIDGKFFAFPDFPFLHYWRPLSLFSFYLDYQLWGLNPSGYHLFNIVINAFNALLVFFIFYEITRKLFYALPVALFFSIHPSHVEATSWISGRTDLLSAFFLLAAMLLFLLYLKNKRVLFYVLTIISFLMALLSKENGVLFPVLAMVMAVVYPMLKDEETPDKKANQEIAYNGFPTKKLMLTLPFWLLDFGYIALHNHFSGVQDVFNNFSFKDIFIIMKTIGAYARTILLPFFPTPHFSMQYFSSHHIEFLAYFVMAVIVILLLILKRQSYKFSLFSLLFFIFLLPVIDPEMVPTYPKIAIRYAYIPAIFAGIFFVESVKQIKHVNARKLLTGFLILVAVIWMAETIKFQGYYKNESRHYSDLLHYYPDDGSLVLPMALIKAGNGKTGEAIELVNHALKINDQDPWLDNYEMASLLKANLLIISGKSEPGKQLVNTILSKTHKKEMVYFGHLILATYYQKQKQFPLALQMLQKAREAGETADLYYRIALAHAYMKEFKQALEYLEKAKIMNPELSKYNQLKSFLLNLIKQTQLQKADSTTNQNGQGVTGDRTK
jgi:protein O-mannosyl-transferase